MEKEKEKEKSPPRLIGCLLDVSGSMRETFEVGRSDKQATDRLDAVIGAALKLARAERGRHGEAHMFIAIFGLKKPKNVECPTAAVDLCRLADDLLEMEQDDGRDGYDLLEGMARENDIGYREYIRKKFTVDEARIIHWHLSSHPEEIEEFIRAIPRRSDKRGLDNSSAEQSGRPLLTATFPPVNPAVQMGRIVVDFVENWGVNRSKGLSMARKIWSDWWDQVSKIVPRPIDDIIDLLQKLRNRPKSSSDSQEQSAALVQTPSADKTRRSIYDDLESYIYGRTPLRGATEACRAILSRDCYRQMQKTLLIVSDGIYTDNDPVTVAESMQGDDITIATVYLTSNPAISGRSLYYAQKEQWEPGQKTLFSMASRRNCADRPIPVLSSMGWDIPSEGQCALFTSVSSTSALEEFFSMLLSASLGSVDTLVDVVGRVCLDEYVDVFHRRAKKRPSNQKGGDCYAHATAAVIRMALGRIIGLPEYPSISTIRRRILKQFPPKLQGGQSESDSEDSNSQRRPPSKRWSWIEMVETTMSWYGLHYKRVDEKGARQALVNRRPVLSGFNLSEAQWETFANHFASESPKRTTALTLDDMKEGYDDDMDESGHAVVLTGCDPHSLTFLNSWGKEWGDGGSFKVESSEVLGSKQSPEMEFYDIFWYEHELTEEVREAYKTWSGSKVAKQVASFPGVYDLEARCPRCHHSSRIGDFEGTIHNVVCPRQDCREDFQPKPGHLLQAIYMRAGLAV